MESRRDRVEGIVWYVVCRITQSLGGCVVSRLKHAQGFIQLGRVPWYLCFEDFCVFLGFETAMKTTQLLDCAYPVYVLAVST